MRKPCPIHIQRKLTNEQNGRCYYCLVPFGSYVLYNNKLVRTKVEFDHLVPYWLIKDNPDDNWIACCHICNKLKSTKVFKNRKGAIDYVRKKRDNKKMWSVPERVHNEARKEDILFAELSLASMGPKTSTSKYMQDPTPERLDPIVITPMNLCSLCKRPYKRGYKRRRFCIENDCMEIYKQSKL